MIGAMMPRMIALAAAATLVGLAAFQPVARAEQWAYAMQTGHGNHSIQVDVDSIVQQTGYVAARMLYEYYGSGSAPTARSALVDGAFDCKANRFQVLSRTEYTAPEAKGTAGETTRSGLSAERWKAASADPETFAIIDWVCGVAAHKLASP
jgi:surface-adhesin protein E